MDPCELHRALEEMNVAIGETWQNQFSASVDHFCAHAAHALDHGVVTDSDDLAAVNSHSLGPRLLGVFCVNAAVNDDDICGLDDPALRARHRSSTEQERKRLKNGAKRMNFHRHLVLKIRMLAAC